VSEGRRSFRGRVLRERPAAPIVVDASVAVLWLTPEPGSAGAGRLEDSDALLLAPDFLPIEVANVLWKKVRRDEMTARQAEDALTDLTSGALVIMESAPLVIRAMRLAVELGHPVYDCLYLALAREWSATLATADGTLRRAAERLQLKVWRP
jgi:predicted nucleic acid-binding protein